ncbi:MAG: formylglycine-generating enzyme family protein, partial [Sulfitobacter sp.]|nr:formylglycine-generating enzyme family protein [Sulfitobacter sp.]
GFELENGYDSSDWKEQQYPNKRAGTRPVGGKQANPWGLYDMLGNVFEWCQDSWHESYDGAPVDGSARESDEAGAARVVRGGSWDGVAWYCRCAYRYGFRPGSRVYYLGFRCARVQGS